MSNGKIIKKSLSDGVNILYRVPETNEPAETEPEGTGEIETEAVEMCPYCGEECVFPNWNVDVQGFVAVCPTCGREIFLCDECQHADDNPGRKCDWQQRFAPGGLRIIGTCFRGQTCN